jgi:hypothetical protein
MIIKHGNHEKSSRMVQVLHKRDNETKQLAVGKTFAFKSGSRLTVLETGQVVNPDKQRRKRKITVG